MSSQKVSNWTAPAAPPGSPTLTGLGSDPRALRSFTMNAGEMTSLAATNHLPATLNGVAIGSTYDAQGNLTAIYGNPGTSASLLTMTYDALGRVATMGDTAHSTSQTYGFDDEGLRMKTLDSATGLISYNIYDEGRKLIAQYTVPSGGSLTWKKDLIYVGAKEVAEADSAGKTWVQFEDHLGSPRLAWDGTATTSVDGVHLVAQKFAPFGESLYTVSAAKFAKGFTNHEQTDASGLIYMQARFYAPMYGRFLSPDPARDQHFEQTQSWNIYSYVQNDPTMRIDPTGMVGTGDATHMADDQAKKKAQADAAKTQTPNTAKPAAKDGAKATDKPAPTLLDKMVDGYNWDTGHEDTDANGTHTESGHFSGHIGLTGFKIDFTMAGVENAALPEESGKKGRLKFEAAALSGGVGLGYIPKHGDQADGWTLKGGFDLFKAAVGVRLHNAWTGYFGGGFSLGGGIDTSNSKFKAKGELGVVLEVQNASH